MNVETPRLEIHIDRIAHNASAVISQCGAQGIRVAAVTKVMQAHPALLRALEGSGCVMLADSRIDNLKRMAEVGPGLPTMLLRAPTPGNAPEAVRWADHTLISSYQTAEALSNAAGMAGVRHKVVMMVDVGDLREGVWPDRAVEAAWAAIRQAPPSRMLESGRGRATARSVIEALTRRSNRRAL